MEIEARRMNTILRTFRELDADDMAYMLGKLQRIFDDKDTSQRAAERAD